MSLTQVQKEMAERIAELLVQSNLDEALKELIIDGLDELPEGLTSKLLETLETENEQLEKVALGIEKYLADQDSNWQDTEEKQKNFAEKFLEDAAQALDDQAQIQELKESI